MTIENYEIEELLGTLNKTLASIDESLDAIVLELRKVTYRYC